MRSPASCGLRGLAARLAFARGAAQSRERAVGVARGLNLLFDDELAFLTTQRKDSSQCGNAAISHSNAKLPAGDAAALGQAVLAVGVARRLRLARRLRSLRSLHARVRVGRRRRAGGAGAA